MKQRRFFEARGEEGGEWLVLDAKRHPPHVICKCVGWNAPQEPFRIFGNTYYVGTAELSAILIAGDDGLVFPQECHILSAYSGGG